MRKAINELSLTSSVDRARQARLSPHQTVIRKQYKKQNQPHESVSSGNGQGSRLPSRSSDMNEKFLRRELRPPSRHWNRIKSSSADMIGWSFPGEEKKIPIIFNSMGGRRGIGTRYAPTNSKKENSRMAYMQNRQKSRYSQARVLKSMTTCLGEDFINLFH